MSTGFPFEKKRGQSAGLPSSSVSIFIGRSSVLCEQSQRR
jgi:hypothetical protein